MRTSALIGLLPHVERFVGDYERDRRAAGVADFDDLLFWARDLLRDSQPARSYFRRRFKVLLIDEFQDTDPVSRSSRCCSRATLIPRRTGVH